MINVVYGAVGVLLTLGLLVVGGLVGWKAHKKYTENAKVVAESQYTEEQVKRMKDEKVAFEEMLNYTAATAYNMNGDAEQLLKGED